MLVFPANLPTLFNNSEGQRGPVVVGDHGEYLVPSKAWAISSSGGVPGVPHDMVMASCGDSGLAAVMYLCVLGPEKRITAAMIAGQMHEKTVRTVSLFGGRRPGSAGLRRGKQLVTIEPRAR